MDTQTVPQGTDEAAYGQYLRNTGPNVQRKLPVFTYEKVPGTNSSEIGFAPKAIMSCELTAEEQRVSALITGILVTTPGQDGGRGVRLCFGALFVDGGFWTPEVIEEGTGRRKAGTGIRLTTHARVTMITIDNPEGDGTIQEMEIEREKAKGDPEGVFTGRQRRDAVIHPMDQADKRTLNSAVRKLMRTAILTLDANARGTVEPAAAFAEDAYAGGEEETL